ncbi:MAG: hypothetical protein N2204_04445 [Anaerolineae bacterium]|nr:hypothetical protein [Anaerolineae bacterium]
MATFIHRGVAGGMRICPENHPTHVPGIFQSAWHVGVFIRPGAGRGMDI